MDVATSSRVIARNDIGRFIRAVEQSGQATVRDLVEQGESLSRAMAPVGTKHDPRTVTLKQGMFSRMTGRTSGMWGNFARHALPIEKGARPHVIRGNPSLGFFWEAMRRRWVPAAVYYKIPGLEDLVNHPGNAAQPFLRPAYDVIAGRAMAVARKHYGR